MTEFYFYLLANQYGERLIFYTCPNGSKMIDAFSKIPYTADSLFEDMEDGFSAFPWAKCVPHDFRTLSWDYYNSWKWMEDVCPKCPFDELVCCMVGETSVLCDFDFEKMTWNEFVLLEDFRHYMRSHCEKNNIEFFVLEDDMEIYKFLNSRDIREYWERSGYEPTALEAAWLVWQSKNHTLKEKHLGWLSLIDNCEDIAIPAGFYDLPQPSLHEFLKRYTEIELQLISDFYKEEPNTVYFYREYFDDDWYEEANLFHTFEEAQAFAVEVNDVDVPQPNFIEFVKTYIGEVDKKIFVRFNLKKEIVRVDENQYLTDEKDYEIFQEVFRNMWFSFPTPFKKGDVVKTVRGVYTRPSYLNGTFVLTSVCNSSDREDYFKENGDGSDMTAHGYFVDFEGMAYHECIHNYMDLEYVRDPLENEEKVLHPISKYLKGEIDLGLLLGAYRYIISTHEANMVRMSLRYTKEGKELAGMER